MTLFDRVKEISKQKGYTLTELADKAGIGEKSMYTWKPSEKFPNGVTPKRATLEKVAKALNVSVDYLLGSEDTNQSSLSETELDLDKALAEKGLVMKFNGKELSDKAKKGLLNVLEMWEEE